MDRNRQTLTVEEAARVLGISRGVAYESARRGELPVVRLGRRLLVPRPRLEELLGGKFALNDDDPAATPGRVEESARTRRHDEA